MAAKRRLSLSYGELSERRELYRPRHAAPTMMARLLRRLGRLRERGLAGEAAQQQPGRKALPAPRQQLSLPPGLAHQASSHAVSAAGVVTMAAAPQEPAADSDTTLERDGVAASYRYILLPAPVSTPGSVSSRAPVP